jgi:hypothetical protein
LDYLSSLPSPTAPSLPLTHAADAVNLSPHVTTATIAISFLWDHNVITSYMLV